MRDVPCEKLRIILDSMPWKREEEDGIETTDSPSAAASLFKQQIVRRNPEILSDCIGWMFASCVVSIARETFLCDNQAKQKEPQNAVTAALSRAIRFAGGIVLDMSADADDDVDMETDDDDKENPGLTHVVVGTGREQIKALRAKLSR